MIQLMAGHTPDRKFSGSHYSYGSAQISGSLQVPLFAKRSRDLEKVNAFQISGQIQNSYQIHCLGGFDFQSLQTGLGLNGWYLHNPKNIWISNISLQYLADANQLSQYFLRPNGNLIYGHKFSQQWLIFSGFSYNFLFGSGFALPLLGFSYKSGSNFSLMLVLPLMVRANLKHNPKWISQVSLRPQGGISVFEAPQLPIGNFGKEGKKQILRQRAFALSYQLLFLINSNWRIATQLGFLGRRKIWISEGEISSFGNENNVFSGNLKSGSFLGISVSYRFGKRRQAEEQKKVELPGLNLGEEELKQIKEQDLDFDNLDIL
jgi:hypothetical protein